MDNLSLAIDIISIVLGAILLGECFLFIFAPLFNFSMTHHKNIFLYFSDVFFDIILKVIALIMLFVIVPITFPVLYALDFIFHYFQSEYIPWNILEMFIIGLWIFIAGMTCFLILRERRDLASGLISKVSAKEIEACGVKHSSKSTTDLLQGFQFFAYHGDELTAFTYGALLMRPRIIISRPLLSPSWSNQLRSILLHEINHIERRDVFYALILYTFDRLICGILKMINFPFKLLGNIPGLSIIGKVMEIFIDFIWSIWRTYLTFTNLVSQKSEFFADSETFGTHPSQYFILGLDDVFKNRVSHYFYKPSEVIAKEIIEEDVNYETYTSPSLLTRFSHLYHADTYAFDSHPQKNERLFWAAIHSERLDGFEAEEYNLHNRKRWYPFYLMIFILMVPLSYFTYIEVKRSANYEFREKEVLEYEAYLKEKVFGVKDKSMEDNR